MLLRGNHTNIRLAILGDEETWMAASVQEAGVVEHSNGTERPTPEELAQLFTLPDGMLLCRSGRFRSDALCSFTSLSEAEHARATTALAPGDLTAECGRAIGCLMGLLVGDAVGAPHEFTAVRYADSTHTAAQVTGFDPALWVMEDDRCMNRFKLQMGQWTDVCSSPKRTELMRPCM